MDSASLSSSAARSGRTVTAELRAEMQALRGEMQGELRGEMQGLRGELHAEIQAAKADIIKWLVPLLLGQAALIAALVRLL